MKRKQEAEKWIKIIGAVVTFIMLIILVAAIRKVADDSEDDGKRQLETSIRRSVMACYADEGVYPPDIDYLKDHYGIQIDEERFVVYYSVFAENLMPDITVLERTQ